MTYLPRIVALSLALVLLLPGLCPARQVIDQVGRVVTVPDQPRRVVALAPNVAELVFLLGREELLKGVTQYSNEPPAARELPRVGSYVRLDIEKILALKPDLCLAVKDGNPLAVIERLVGLGIAVYVVDPKNLEEIMTMVTGLGEVLGAAERATRIVADMRDRLARVEARVAPSPERPGVFFQIDAAPIVSAGSQTFIDELISRAGGRNLAAGGQPYPRFGWEEILRLAPEVVIVASMAGGHSVAELKSGWRQWPQIPAVKNERIYVVEADLVDRPSPRLVEGLEAFARIIHPELFDDREAD
jgi:iron complex transport system substrate-binding protein